LGGGTARKSLDNYVHSTTGRAFRVNQALTEQETKLFTKKKWKYTSEACKPCGGAGMVKVGGSDA